MLSNEDKIARRKKLFPNFTGKDALPESLIEVEGVVGGGEFEDGAVGVGGGVVTE